MAMELQNALPAPADTAGIAPGVAEQAVQWWVTLQARPVSAAQHSAWQTWRDADAEHGRAWRRIEAVSAQLAGVSSPLARAALAVPASARRRRTVQLLTALLVAGGGAAVVRGAGPWGGWPSDHATAVGERRTVVLADGSTLVLNTGSAVDVRLDETRRVLWLVRGEILVQTAVDARRRPFLVHTDAGSVRAIGTRFTVRARAEVVEVGVLQGAVELRPTEAPEALRLLQAGEEGRFTPTGVGEVRPIGEGAGAWIEGMLVVSGMRLDDFLNELGRYRRGRLGCDPAIGHLKVSGAYPLDNTDQVLSALAFALPIEVHAFTRYWVTLRARPQRG